MKKILNKKENHSSEKLFKNQVLDYTVLDHDYYNTQFGLMSTERTENQSVMK